MNIVSEIGMECELSALARGRKEPRLLHGSKDLDISGLASLVMYSKYL